MNRVELSRTFSVFTHEMNTIFSRLETQYNKINENYGNAEADLLLEGFWDTMKKVAGKVGGAVGGGVATAKNVVSGIKQGANWLWDKGVALGEQALQVINNLAKKIEGYLTQAYNFIVSAPSKFKAFMINLWSETKKSFDELKTKTSEKFQQIYDSVKAKIAAKIVEPLKNKWTEIQNNFQTFKGNLKSEAAEMKVMAGEFKKSSNEKLKMIGDGIETGLEAAGLFVIGLILLPFYGVYKGSEYLYDLGEKVVESVKANAPEVWNSFATEYQKKANPAPAASNPAPNTTTERRNIKKFGDYVKENYKG